MQMQQIIRPIIKHHRLVYTVHGFLFPLAKAFIAFFISWQLLQSLKIKKTSYRVIISRMGSYSVYCGKLRLLRKRRQEKEREAAQTKEEVRGEQKRRTKQLQKRFHPVKWVRGRKEAEGITYKLFKNLKLLFANAQCKTETNSLEVFHSRRRITRIQNFHKNIIFCISFKHLVNINKIFTMSVQYQLGEINCFEKKNDFKRVLLT